VQDLVTEASDTHQACINQHHTNPEEG
jgi:hypothetical protein